MEIHKIDKKSICFFCREQGTLTVTVKTGSINLCNYCFYELQGLKYPTVFKWQWAYMERDIYGTNKPIREIQVTPHFETEQEALLFLNAKFENFSYWKRIPESQIEIDEDIITYKEEIL